MSECELIVTATRLLQWSIYIECSFTVFNGQVDLVFVDCIL